MPRLFLRKYIFPPTPAPLDERDVKWGVQDLLKFVGIFFAALMLFVLLGPRLDNAPSRSELVYFLLMKHVATVLALLWFFHRGLLPGLEYFGLQLRHFRMHFLTGVVWGLICRFVPALVVLLITLVNPASWQSNNLLRDIEITGVSGSC